MSMTIEIIHHQTYLVFLDLTKAFDSVSHELLLSKLKETGISIEFCKWMESYLANRVQRVKLNNSASPYTAIKYGVPQRTRSNFVLDIYK